METLRVVFGKGIETELKEYWKETTPESGEREREREEKSAGEESGLRAEGSGLTLPHRVQDA